MRQYDNTIIDPDDIGNHYSFCMNCMANHFFYHNVKEQTNYMIRV